MPERNIGGIPIEDIEAHYEAAGIPGDAGADRAIRFLRRLSSLIAQRVAAGEPNDGALFLLAEKVADIVKDHPGVSKPALVAGNDEISGKVWAVNARLGNAHSLELVWVTGEGFDSVITAGLGTLPALALDLRDSGKPHALFLPDGCAEPDAMFEVYLSEHPIGEAQMKQTLDNFYEDNLRTPMTVLKGHGDRIWKDSGNGVPNERPEETIEMLLSRHLQSVYPSHDTRAQSWTEDGFLDIAMHYNDRTAVGYPAKRCDWVLELKALADRTANDNPRTMDIPDVMTKGLRQAIAYSADLQSLASALCIYDFRDVTNDDESCFEDIRVDARDHQIHLWRWRLLRSAEEGREQRFPLRSDGHPDADRGGAGS